MTYLVIWEFDVAVERCDEFESAYGPRGPWRDLFAPADGYLGTELMRAPSGSRYLTLDRWDQRVSYDTFMASRADDYRVLDVRLEGIAQTERRIGDFDTVD